MGPFCDITRTAFSSSQKVKKTKDRWKPICKWLVVRSPPPWYGRYNDVTLCPMHVVIMDHIKWGTEKVSALLGDARGKTWGDPETT